MSQPFFLAFLITWGYPPSLRWGGWTREVVLQSHQKQSCVASFGFFIRLHLQKPAFDVSQIKKPAFRLAFDGFGGERGIRTLDTLLAYTHFPGVLLQPLGHLSRRGQRYSIFLVKQNLENPIKIISRFSIYSTCFSYKLAKFFSCRVLIIKFRLLAF